MPQAPLHPPRFLLVTAWLFCVWLPQVSHATTIADTVIWNAKVYTVDARKPWADAIAIKGGRILAVGTQAEIAPYRGKSTLVIDARSRLVLPSMTDCHVHLLEGSLALSRLNLDDAPSVAEVQQRLRGFATSHPGKGWLLGRGWTYPIFGDTGLPQKKDLDAVTTERPVALDGYDMHTVWVNSKALALAGITRDTPDPPNGTIVRDASTGEPTGTLKEAAAQLIWNIIPPPTREEKLAALRQGLHEANRWGIGRLHSAGRDFDTLALFEQLRRHDELTARLYVAYPLQPPKAGSKLSPDVLAKLEDARRTYHGEWLSTGAVKVVLDGIVETHTAAMLEPYTDVPQTRGEPFWTREALANAVKTLDQRGFQIFTHAIGDLAVRMALDAYQPVAQGPGGNHLRHRLEHLETVAESDAPRLGALGIIASFQPLHAYPDATTLDTWAGKIGTERASRGFGWQRIARTGGRLAFGSDWPVVTLNPWHGVQMAVTRETLEGTPKGGWLPEQRLSLEQAVRGYTLDAAFAAQLEDSEGSLEPGKRADLIMLNQNIFDVDPHQIHDTQVALTLVGGRIVYSAEAAGGGSTQQH